MASPLTVGTTATVVALVNKKRVSIRFQNTGNSVLYIKKIPLTGTYTPVSELDYEVMLASTKGPEETGESFITNSVAGFMAISDKSGGVLAVYETSKV